VHLYVRKYNNRRGYLRDLCDLLFKKDPGPWLPWWHK